MGLDMYLSKKIYVKRWEHQKPEEKYSVLVKKGGKEVDSVNADKVSYVIEEVAYWRKANAIHNWFVLNVQDGVDNCSQYYVDREDLEKLVTTVKSILKHKGKPEEKELVLSALPPTSGFFFGSTEIDEWFWKDMESTVEELEPLIAKDKDGQFKDLSGDFYYQSSW